MPPENQYTPNNKPLCKIVWSIKMIKSVITPAATSTRDKVENTSPEILIEDEVDCAICPVS